MLRGMSPLLSPGLLSVLWRMGHGDEIVFADAHFPGESMMRAGGGELVRADGIGVAALLGAVMPWFDLDQYVDCAVVMMAAVEGDKLDASVEASYRAAMGEEGASVEIERMERFAFYERTERAFAVVMTGETAQYGNIILKKGVVSVG